MINTVKAFFARLKARFFPEEEDKRTEKQKRGEEGEDIAADFLEDKGYKILYQNYRVGKDEIDIIAEDKKRYIFCEVKTRVQKYGLSSPYGRPGRAVDKEKQKHLIRAASSFSARHKYDGKRFRFDVVEVYLDPDGKVGHIHHIENAFTLS